ncbi:MAG TPA: hypothetical protein VMD04_03125, partial [Candidatus Margulisiibacteriota bacterium]|nr:hypothetical protein [Candidatus Margulisiibacteriota bacterium]
GYTKQSYFCVTLAIALYLCFKKKNHLAFEFLSAYLIIGCAIFLWLNHITNGSFYLSSVVTAITMVPHSLPNLFYTLGRCAWKISPVFLLAFFSLYRTKGLHPLVMVYALLSCAAAVLSSTTVWSADNYWLEALAPSIILAAPAVSRVSIRKDKIIAAILLPLFLFTYLRFPLAYFRGRFEGRDKLALEYDRPVVKFLMQTKGEVFYDGYPDLLILSGKNVFSSDWSTYILSVRKNKCAGLEVIDKIRRKEFSYLIFYRGFSRAHLIPGMGEEVKNNYRFKCRIGSHEIFTPLAKDPTARGVGG